MMGQEGKFPEEAELAAQIREAAAARKPLEIAGGGSKLCLGRPVIADRRLHTTQLSGISLYEPEALTVIVKAGTRLSELQRALAAERQQLAFEPPDYRDLLGTKGQPTIGGVIACGLSGPRRIHSGAARDALLGARFIDGSGTILKSGGRVMKNVTGYDLGKLLCGSYGTLGVMTELTFRLRPIPETVVNLLLSGLDDAAAVKAMTLALSSSFEVSGAAHLRRSDDRNATTILRLEGAPRSVATRADRLRAELEQWGPVELEKQVAARRRWTDIRDVRPFAGRPGVVWRVSLRPGHAPAFLAELPRQTRSGAILDWGGGLVWLLAPEKGDCHAAAIRVALAKFRGHAMLFRAGAEMRAAIPVFEPQPAALEAISHRLRVSFDPAGILNPGRMFAIQQMELH